MLPHNVISLYSWVCHIVQLSVPHCRAECATLYSWVCHIASWVCHIVSWVCHIVQLSAPHCTAECATLYSWVRHRHANIPYSFGDASYCYLWRNCSFSLYLSSPYLIRPYCRRAVCSSNVGRSGLYSTAHAYCIRPSSHTTFRIAQKDVQL
jgi:hypothetical protein